MLRVISNVHAAAGSPPLHYRERERESLLAQTLNNFMQIKAKALGHRKNLLNRLSRRAPLDSFINSYRGLKLMAELLRI